MSKYRLKAWPGPEWQRQLSQTVTVSRVDEDIPTDKQEPQRKPWFIALTQEPDLLTDVGGVDGLPAGHTLLLSEDDVVALVGYLLEPQTAAFVESPSASEPGDFELFVEPGMVGVTPDGEVFNGEAHWSPAYFHKAQPFIQEVNEQTVKVHTLPWKWEPPRKPVNPVKRKNS